MPSRRVDTIDLEGVENGMGADLDEGVTAPRRTLLGAVEGHAGLGRAAYSRYPGFVLCGSDS